MNLNAKQHDIIGWMINHPNYDTIYGSTALATWQLLFRQRESDYPDKVIGYYDNLTSQEKADVELVVARYFAISNRSGKRVSFGYVLRHLTNDVE